MIFLQLNIVIIFIQLVIENQPVLKFYEEWNIILLNSTFTYKYTERKNGRKTSSGRTVREREDIMRKDAKTKLGVMG